MMAATDDSFTASQTQTNDAEALTRDNTALGGSEKLWMCRQKKMREVNAMKEKSRRHWHWKWSVCGRFVLFFSSVIWLTKNTHLIYGSEMAVKEKLECGSFWVITSRVDECCDAT